MMFLYHIFNPPSDRLCDACKKPLERSWFQCSTCTEFDLCTDCFRSQKHSHDPSHKLVEKKQSDNPFISLAQQQARRRRLERQSELLVHVIGGCRLRREGICHKYGPQCVQMESLWKHVHSCKHGKTGKCDSCNFVRNVFKYHLSHCRNRATCPVPQCRMERNHIRSQQLSLRAQHSLRNGSGHAHGSRANGNRVTANMNRKTGQAHKENDGSTAVKSRRI
jgi:hypothetical protein